MNMYKTNMENYENVRKCMKLYENTFPNTFFDPKPYRRPSISPATNNQKVEKHRLCGNLFDPKPYRRSSIF